VNRKLRCASGLFGHISLPHRYPTPLRYAGGKSLAVAKILPLIPRDAQTIASPFALKPM